MKKLVCEMCGSSDLVKQDGLFVCQYCGAKYSLEEARKMMIEGTVDVTGSTIKIDNSQELENLYKLAHRAKNDNNYENAEKYYDMILIKDPDSWEASFYVVYFKQMRCKIAQIQSAANSVENCIDTVLKLIKNNVKDSGEQIIAVKEVSDRCTAISDMLYNAALNHYNGIDMNIRSNYTQEMVNNCCAARDIMYTLGNNIDYIFGTNEMGKFAINAWSNGIHKHNQLMNNLLKKQQNKEVMLRYISKIKKYDPDYLPPKLSSGMGCYIATAVYGSYDCPQVWTLRRFRDGTLSKTWYGRAFIKTYYAISPTLVKWFGNTEWFRKIWKKALDPMVENLQLKGVESTPYKDKE
ncbi:MAG: TFIIB-type zinc finger domain-containing protein [Acutalibacteraceae bacterium]